MLIKNISEKEIEVRVQGEELLIPAGKTIQTTLDKANELVANYPLYFEIIKDVDSYILSVTGGGGGSSVLTADITANVEVGGVTSGTTFSAGTPLENVIKDTLVKYFAPTISLTINPSTSPVISGTTIESVAMSAVATKRSDDITSIRFYANNTLIHEETTEVADGGTFTYTYAPSDPIADDVTFKVTVSDGTSDVNATKKIDFVAGSYFGDVADTVTTPTADDITALTQVALTTKGYTKTGINMTYGKLLYAYPASYGNLTSIKDGNNFEYINSYTKSTVAINGIDYNCYLMTEATGVSNFKQVYA